MVTWCDEFLLWLQTLPFPLRREALMDLALTLSKVPCHVFPPTRESGFFYFFNFLYIWPNLHQSDCSIFGISLEAAEQSFFFICSKYLSFNVSDDAKGRSWHGWQSWMDRGSGKFLFLILIFIIIIFFTWELGKVVCVNPLAWHAGRSLCLMSLSGH
jgi:hypothetical protein